MNHYDVTIRETLEVKIKVAATAGRRPSSLPGTNGNAAKSFWTPAILPAWSSMPSGISVTGASDEFFFRLSRIPRRGMECSCTSKHRLCDTTKAAC